MVQKLAALVRLMKEEKLHRRASFTMAFDLLLDATGVKEITTPIEVTENKEVIQKSTTNKGKA